MTEKRREYPDNSDIYALKAKGRAERAKLSFADKLDAVDALRERVRPIVEARNAREAALASAKAILGKTWVMSHVPVRHSKPHAAILASP